MPDARAVERRIVSVLFADIVGFTPLSESLDAEDVAAIQDAYFSAVRETVGRYGGVLEKFIGDAAMAVFGVPRGRDDDAERAVRAGLALVSAVEQLGARLGLDPGALRLRVGVNSGEVAHAVSGADAGRVTGDAVNVAARLQAAAAPGSVLIGELTALAVEEAVEIGPAVEVELKGKSAPVRARTATGLRPAPSREDMLGRLRAPLLGREDELARLLAELHRHADGRTAGRLVLVAPPGIGKSRLLAELARSAAERGADAQAAAVLRARVRPQAATPYQAVAGLVAAALALEPGGGAPGDRVRGAMLAAGATPERAAHVAHETEALLDVTVAATADGREALADERSARFSAWCAALDAMAGPRPAVWIVEDVHWAGADLLAFLSQSASEPADHGRLVLASARPSLLESAAAWAAAGERLELEPLPAVAAASLVTALVGDALPAALVAAVAERSDGNPLFIEELLRTWISVGTLVPEASGWRLALEPELVALPATVQAIYAAQLDDLPADARQVARRAAVAGRRFPTAAFDPLEITEHAPGLDVLRRRAFVSGPADDPLVGDTYAYRHALLRDAGYASLARAERARLHAALARWLESTAGARADAVAEAIGDHYASALASLPAVVPDPTLDPDELRRSASAWLERGAGEALRLSAHEAGIRLLHRSIELTADSETADLARRRLELGDVLAQSDDLAAGMEELQQALALYDARLGPDPAAAAADDRAGYARAALSRAAADMQQIRFPQAELVTRDALLRLGSGEDAASARLLALRAWAVGAQGRPDGVIAGLDRALAIAERLDDPELVLEVLVRRAAVQGEMVGETRPVDWADLERRAREVGQWRQVVNCLRNRAADALDAEPRAALPILDEAAAIADARGYTEHLGWIELGRCETHFVAGDWEAALRAGDAALRLGERYAYVRLAFRTWMVLLPMLAIRDADPGRTAAMLDRHDGWWALAREAFPPNPSPYGQVLLAATSIHRAAARGDVPPPVDDALLAPLARAFDNPHHLACRESIVAEWIRAGRLDAARAAADDLAAAANEPESGTLRVASAALLGAWMALAEERAADAVASARRSLAVVRTAGSGFWTSRALRALEAAGAATPDEVAEAAHFEAGMGVAPLVPPRPAP